MGRLEENAGGRVMVEGVRAWVADLDAANHIA